MEPLIGAVSLGVHGNGANGLALRINGYFSPCRVHFLPSHGFLELPCEVRSQREVYAVLSPQELFSVIQEQVNQVLPDATKSAQEDLSANLKMLVSGIIGRLDLVSREEFDAQQAVLLRTREKLEALEKEVAELEARMASNGPDTQACDSTTGELDN